MSLIKEDEIIRRMALGIELGAIRALTEHKNAGRSIAVWKDNKVVRIPAEEIVIPECPEEGYDL